MKFFVKKGKTKTKTKKQNQKHFKNVCLSTVSYEVFGFITQPTFQHVRRQNFPDQIIFMENEVFTKILYYFRICLKFV